LESAIPAVIIMFGIGTYFNRKAVRREFILPDGI
jgi:hypothetical protein